MKFDMPGGRVVDMEIETYGDESRFWIDETSLSGDEYQFELMQLCDSDEFTLFIHTCPLNSDEWNILDSWPTGITKITFSMAAAYLFIVYRSFQSGTLWEIRH